MIQRLKLAVVTTVLAGLLLVGSSSAFVVGHSKAFIAAVKVPVTTGLAGKKDGEQEKRRGSKKSSMTPDGNRNNHKKKKKKRNNANNDAKNKFATGRELEILRSELDTFRETLQWSEAIHDKDRIKDLSIAIEKAEARDPDIAYAKALEEIEKLTAKASSQSTIEKLAKEAEFIRTFLPRFQLEGLWVGNYGAHGLQLINVTYQGDTLVATKVTGDESVPRGEVSFRADLAPDFNASLPPLKLSLSSPSSAPSLARYKGQGQVAKPGFVDSEFIDGQFVISRDCFSFVWVGLPPQTNSSAASSPPYRRQLFHQVLFRRPTPEQTIHLLRNVVSQEDELENMRQHLTRCLDLDVTESLARHHAYGPPEPFRRISLQEDLEVFEKQQQQQAKQKKEPSSSSTAGDLADLLLNPKRTVVDKFLSRLRHTLTSMTTTTNRSEDDVGFH